MTAQADAQNSRTQILRDFYNNQANLYQNISLGAWIAACAIYIFSVVDAIGSDGEKVYVENKNIKLEFNTKDIQRSTGISLLIRF